MKIAIRIRLFILVSGMLLISGCGKEQTAEQQFLEKIEEYKSDFTGQYTAGTEGSGEAAVRVETREIESDSSEGGELIVYTDADGQELRYRLNVYGETGNGNAVTNYYLCDGFVWVSKETNHYSSWILKEGFSDILYSDVKNWIVTDDKTYILHDNGELEETAPEEAEITDLRALMADDGMEFQGEAWTWQDETIEPEETASSESDELMIEQEAYAELFLQELLFVQQGFRQHNIEGSYTVYFAEPEQSEDGGYQDMLLEGEDGVWRENISYTYNQSENWYTFQGQFEPALVKDSLYVSSDKEAEEFKNAAVYETELSARSDIDASIRFMVPSGPVIYDDRREEGDWDDDLYTYVYVYQDERMGVTVEIEYPQYSLYADGLSEAEEINQRIKEAFFYGYGSENEEWTPTGEMYGTINRNYEVKRMDDRYLSLCIYEYNSFRGANHPNEWKSGMTIDLKTGKLLTLRDVIGTDRTAKELADTGAFHCLQIWRDGELTPEMLKERDKEQVEEAIKWVHEDATDDFYLTPDKLGLTSYFARYYVCMEAPFAELGLDEWEAKEGE